MTLSKDQRDAAIKWLADLPPHILREKIERGYDFGSGKTFSDKGKIMEVLQQTACIAEMLAERLAAVPSALSGDAGDDGGRIIRFSDEKGDFVVGEDGCTIFWPEGIARGGFNAWHLRALADELDRRNADWMAQMRADFAALPSHQGAE